MGPNLLSLEAQTELRSWWESQAGRERERGGDKTKIMEQERERRAFDVFDLFGVVVAGDVRVNIVVFLLDFFFLGRKSCGVQPQNDNYGVRENKRTKLKRPEKKTNI
jgi:hypothetical protein